MYCLHNKQSNIPIFSYCIIFHAQITAAIDSGCIFSRHKALVNAQTEFLAIYPGNGFLYLFYGVESSLRLLLM